MIESMKEIKITTEYITLGQFLKFADIISNGGEAKNFLMFNSVLINGVEDNRRGRKIRAGDIVEVKGLKFSIQWLLVKSILQISEGIKN